MRYIAMKDSTGEWGVFDVRTQSYVASGLDQEDATDGARIRNEKNDKEVRDILGKVNGGRP